MPFQTGGSIRMPYRMFNESGSPFQPGSSDPAFQPGCTKVDQSGGSVRMPHRYFNPNAHPFRPSACSEMSPMMKSSSSCPCSAMSSCPCSAMSSCPCSAMSSGPKMVIPNSPQSGGAAYNDCPNCLKFDLCYQKGGNPVGAPFNYFAEGNSELQYSYPLRYSNPVREAPKFDKVGANRFWQR